MSTFQGNLAHSLRVRRTARWQQVRTWRIFRRSVRRGEKRKRTLGVHGGRAALMHLQVAAIVLAAVALSVGAFWVFRSVARLLLLQTGGTAHEAADAVPPGALNPTELPPSREAVIAAVLAWDPPFASDKPTPLDRAAALPIVSGDHVLGSQLAPITLMLFADLQCPYSLHSVQTLIRRVQAQPDEFRLVWREQPLDIHPNAAAMATEAERLSIEHGEAAFWRYVSALSQLERLATPGDVSVIVHALQGPSPRVNDAAAADKALQHVQSDQRIAAAYSIRESPTLFVNGLRVEADLIDAELDEMIEEERDAIDDLLQDPVPRARVYAIRVHQNLLDLELD